MAEGADALERTGVGIGIVGRIDERARIDALLDGAATGSSGAVVVAGPPGIGKSALLDYAVEQAAPFRILRVAGVESETAFGYAGVHQLVGPILDHAGALADPQRDALDAALGRIEHPRFDPFVVVLAVLSLLGAAARAQPVLAVVDDAQWLDDESATVIAFVARRLQAESVAVLVAIRDTSDRPIEFERLPRLNVDGVSATDARALVTSAAGGVLDDAVADHIVAASAGNPLALLELPKALTAEQLRGAVPLPDPLPIGPHLSNVFTARLRALSGAAKTALLLAAVEQMGDPSLFRRAASTLAGLAWDEAATEAEASGLVKFEPLVSFRHPLVRSAVYYASSPAQRRRVHAALATVLGLGRRPRPTGVAPRRGDDRARRAGRPSARGGGRARPASGQRVRRGGLPEAGRGTDAIAGARHGETAPSRPFRARRRAGPPGKGSLRPRRGPHARSPRAGRYCVDRGVDPSRRRSRP